MPKNNNVETTNESEINKREGNNNGSSSHNTANIIEGIIRLRQPLAKNIATEIEYVGKIITSLEQLEIKRQEIIGEIGKFGFSEDLNQINLVDSTESLKKILQKLSKLAERFSRKTINVGVVGRARQGKSTFLRTLTRLTDNFIPTGEGGPCTAVRSKIMNRQILPLDKNNNPYNAKIFFHSRESLLNEVILPYYEKLNYKNQAPHTIEEFFTKKLPDPPSIDEPMLRNLYKRLAEDYYTNGKYYKNFLDKEPLEIQESQIREYVAHSSNDHKPFYNHLAVNDVEIYCKFPNEDAGKIVVIDIPGLGDKRLGDTERLVETLEQEVDFVLFIRKPEAGGAVLWDEFDLSLYKISNKSLDNLSKRSFMILNKDVIRNNVFLCQEFEKEIKKNFIFVAECQIVNCADKTEVDNLRDSVLRYLVDNIQTLDRNYAAHLQSELIEIYKEISLQLNKSPNALVAISDPQALFTDKFVGKDGRSGFWGEMANNLAAICDDLHKKIKQPDTAFEQKITESIEHLKKPEVKREAIPSVEKINKDSNAEGGYEKMFYTYIYEIRAYLLNHFLDLDRELQKSLNDTKNRVANVLAKPQNSNSAGLENLTDSDDGLFFLKEIQNILSEQFPADSNILSIGFKTLTEFDLSLANIVLRIILKNLREFTPEYISGNRPSVAGTKNALKELLIATRTADAPVTFEVTKFLNKILPGEEQAYQKLPNENGLKTALNELYLEVVKEIKTSLEEIVGIPEKKLLLLLNTFLSKILGSRTLYAYKFSSAAEVEDSLTKLYYKVVGKCEQELQILCPLPNEVAYEMVEIFMTLTLRPKEAKYHWGNFLSRNKSLIWSEFKHLEELAYTRQKWESHILEAKSAIQKMPDFINIRE